MLELTVLGTGVPAFVGSDRAGPGALVTWQSEGAESPAHYLIDAGRWVTQRLGESGVPWMHAAAMLFTHHHMDHNVGWPDLCMTGWQMGRQTRWRVYGPPPTAEFCRLQEEAFAYDRARRFMATTDGALADVTEISAAGTVIDEGGLRVIGAVVPHGDCEPAFAYRFEAGGNAVVISGDCSPNDALVDLASGADVLLHEVLHRPSLERLLAQRPGYNDQMIDRMVGIHTTADDVGKVAERAHVKKLVLTHFIPPVFDADALYRTVAADFDGEIVLANDLTRAH